MSEYRQYWDEEIETMPRTKLKEYQLSLLKDMLELTYNKSPYYRRIFDEKGVKPQDRS